MPTETKSSSSGDSERLTIAYTESIPGAEDESHEVTDDSKSSFSTTSTSRTSSSLETPTSQESATSQFDTLDRMRDMESHFGYEPVWRTMSTTGGPKLRALDYFRSQSVFQLFSFLMSHLLANTPEEPVPFLISLLDRCIHYRDNDDEPPPLLFQDSHVNSVYTALDPVGDGSITFRQYLAGMNTLGVTEFNLMPNEGESDYRNVARDVFLKEARMALLNQLNNLLGKLPERSTIVTQRPEFVSSDNSKENTSLAQDDGLVTVSNDNIRPNKTYIVSRD